MPDGPILSRFGKALKERPTTRPYSVGQMYIADLAIVSFLILATALGIVETEFFTEVERPSWRAWGAPIGMVQFWRVFGPQLRPINWHSTAIIEFSDGTLKSYEFPRADKMSLDEAFIKVPETVFFIEKLPNKNFSKMLPAVARFLIRANYDPANQPKQVTFFFYSAPIPAPDSEHWVYRDQLPRHTHSQVFYVYYAQPQDLITK